MAVKKVVPYKRNQRPADPASVPRYTDEELRKIEASIQSLKAAIEQMQQATSLPIT